MRLHGTLYNSPAGPYCLSAVPPNLSIRLLVGSRASGSLPCAWKENSIAGEGWGEEERRAQVHSHLVPMEQQEEPSVAMVPSLFGPRDRFCGRQFFRGLGVGMVSGRFKYVTFIVCFVYIITSAPPQIIRHSVPEAGDPCSVASLCSARFSYTC